MEDLKLKVRTPAQNGEKGISAEHMLNIKMQNDFFVHVSCGTGRREKEESAFSNIFLSCL